MIEETNNVSKKSKNGIIGKNVSLWLRSWVFESSRLENWELLLILLLKEKNINASDCVSNWDWRANAT